MSSVALTVFLVISATYKIALNGRTLKIVLDLLREKHQILIKDKDG